MEEQEVGSLLEQPREGGSWQQQLREQPVQQAHSCCFPKDHTSPGWIKCSQQDRELLLTSSSAAGARGLGSSDPPVPILQGAVFGTREAVP